MHRYGSTITTVCLLVLSLTMGTVAATAAEWKGTKYVRYRMGQRISYGIVEGDRVRKIEGDLFGTWTKTESTYALGDVKILVPTEPTKVLALAGNYKSHLGGGSAHKHPEVFYKVPSCLIAHGEKIVIPKGAKNVHYEAELVIVIGKRAKDVPVSKALDHVLGVTCGNDVSERNWQKGDIQWWRAKASDTFGPCGPFILSGVDYGNLLMELRLNGEVKQRQNTKDMVHGVAEVVSWISKHVTLEPGDLIFTGTMGKTSKIKPGDVVEVTIQGVGTLRNPVVGEQ